MTALSILSIYIYVYIYIWTTYEVVRNYGGIILQSTKTHLISTNGRRGVSLSMKSTQAWLQQIHKGLGLDLWQFTNKNREFNQQEWWCNADIMG